MSGAISMSRAIVNTDVALRRRLPAIATLRFDNEAIFAENHELIEIEPIRPELLTEVGQLSYVRMFDYHISQQFFSRELVRTFDVNLFDLLEEDTESTDWRSLSAQGVIGLESFDLRGVAHPDVLDMEAGLIDLVEGRTFTEEEVETGAPVVVASRSWLEDNDLVLGDNFTLQHRVHRPPAPAEFLTFDLAEFLADDNLLLAQDIEFEVIGVFDHELEFRTNVSRPGVSHLFEITDHLNLLNRIYVPVGFNERIVLETSEILVESGVEDEVIELSETTHVYQGMIFLLYDPLDLLAFESRVNPLLPDFWRVDIASNAYEEVSNSMNAMRSLSTGLIFGAILATATTLSLIVILFLHDRKYEIGLYLALGERKKNIAMQFLLETLIIAPIGITLGLLLGNMLSDVLSNDMIRQELLTQAEQIHTWTVYSNSPANLGFSHYLNHEEMLELFDTSLDIATIVIFYSTSLSIIILSSLIPTLYKLKLNPKDTLMKASIG